MRANAARLLEEAGRLRCEEILAVAPRRRSRDHGARIREVSVSGIRARVEANVKLPGTPGVESRTMSCSNAEDEWR